MLWEGFAKNQGLRIAKEGLMPSSTRHHGTSCLDGWISVRTTIVAAALIAAAVVAPIPTAHADSREKVRLDRKAGSRVVWSTGEVTRPPARQIAAAAETIEGRFATFIVDLDDFPEAARTATRYALRKLAQVVESPQPIVINMTWEPLGGPVAAQASARVHVLKGGFAGEGMWFPDALVNDVAGEDVDPMPEMSVAMDNDDTDWHFGTDANESPDKVDFVDVLMHEVLHGLAFITTLKVTDGEGHWGFENDPETLPMRFDVFVENGDRQMLLSSFDNSSVELAAELTSENLFFAGPTATAANRGNSPELYAPPVWSASSVGHLADIFYGTPDELMTKGYVQPVRQIGPVIRGVLADTGYYVAHARKVLLDDNKHLALAGRVIVPLGYPGCRSNVVVLIQRVRHGDWVKVASERTDGNGDFEIRAGDKAGRYRATIKRQHKGPLKVNDCLAATSETVRHRH